MPGLVASERVDVLERARELSWYHTIELAPGQVTEGVFDHRPYVPRYGLPDRMGGMRALDVGTFDGFWAFEMERRGADVVAIDVDSDEDLDRPAHRRPEEFPDTPRGTAFEVAKEALDSGVERRDVSVYRATPEDLGTFDLVFCSSVVIHLRDQVLALERMASLCTGRLILVEPYQPLLRLLPFPAARFRGHRRRLAPVFWEPNTRAWESMLLGAGFRSVEQRGRFKLRSREGWQVPHVVLHAVR